MSDEPINTEGKGAILTAMLQVMQEVDYIQKDATNPHFGYAYASEGAIKAALQPALLKNGLIFQLETDSEPKNHTCEKLDKKTGALVPATFMSLGCRYTLWHVSGQFITGTFVGSGTSDDDKGCYKAITGAVKYILTSLFLIPTGNDAEADGEEPKAASTQGQATRPVTKNDLAPKSRAGNVVICPNCNTTAFVLKDREGPGYFCWKNAEKNKNGCGHKWVPGFQVPSEVQNRLAGAKRPVPVGADEPPPLDDSDLPF